MKNNLIQIKPSILNPGTWLVEDSFIKSDNNSLDVTDIRGTGFYHYPASMRRIDAFEKLRAAMIKKHEQEIYKLRKSLKSLLGLKA